MRAFLAACVLLVSTVLTACSTTPSTFKTPTQLEEGRPVKAAQARALRKPAMARDAQRTKASISERELTGDRASTALIEASRNGDLETLKRELRADAHQINIRDSVTGLTPLISAIEGAQVEAVRYLLDQGADPTTKGPRGGFALNIAVQRGHVQIAKLLLAGGAPADQKNDSGNTPLHDAAQFNRVPIVGELVRRGANIETRNRQGWPPLVIAAREGHLEVVRALLDSGANANIKGKDSFTPLYWAVFKGNKPLAELLVERGAEVGTISLGALE